MASTYVNDLRLNEMATGDQSGSWGTVTNLNLELIGEAFSYGTEAITTNADTHTTTIADGAADAGRSMFLKYTGTLDSACTITIGPNTVSKVWFIENSTSGSQNIIISQGSGANVTIAAGQTKAVYSDGAGTGAAFVDAFAALSVGALSGTTGTFSGAVTGTSATFDGGVDIDNINIDGTTIALSSGDFTLDVAGDIILDADGGEVFFKDGGASIGLLSMASSNITIKSEVSDKDIILQGNDAGVQINALTLDMSDAGTATFNKDILLGDDSAIRLGASQDLALFHDATNSTIRNNTGDLILDVAGVINLDSDSGNVMFSDGGVEIGLLANTGNSFTLMSRQSDKDIIFKGNDGGSTITALTLDMSAAGAATFNSDVNAPNFNTTSDATLKTNVETLTGSLDAVKSLRGVSFDWIESGGSEVGVIAQEVEAVLPDVVSTNDEGIKSVKYGNMVAVLIEAMKEQQVQIDELKAQING